MDPESKISPFVAMIVFIVMLVSGVNAKPLQHEADSELQMTLSTTTMMLCLGSSLPLEVEIANRGTEQVKIDKVDLWANFVYSFSGANGGRGGGCGSKCDSCRGEFVVVNPDASHHSEFAFRLSSDFFKDTGSYTIKLKYNDILTNQLDFELYDCNPK
ncbi:MAG: hypothetical protein ABR501_02140 [Pyrinomonadaceae bacterium]